MTLNLLQHPFSDWKHELLMRMGAIYLDTETETFYGTTSTRDVEHLIQLQGLGYVRIYKMDYGRIGAELTNKGLDYVTEQRRPNPNA
jgi:hypothetical protein